MIFELAVAAMFAADWREGWNLLGDAEWQIGALRLTPAETEKVGAAWRTEKVPITGGFETSFRFRITQSGGLANGADGIAFVIQNSGPKAIAGIGGAGGFATEGEGKRRTMGIARSIAIFLDTHRNYNMKDPSNNYVGVYSHGRPEKVKWPPPRQGYSKRLRAEMKDGGIHEARISYRPPLLTVSVDGEMALRTSVEMRQVLDEKGMAWVGFTGSTGAGFGNHDILGWEMESVDSNMSSVDSQISFAIFALAAGGCLPDRNLCTPKEGTVETKADGVYEVVLPGHLAWAASVPNPVGRPVDIRNAGGYVCRGEGECEGPAALKMKTEKGRTWFSVEERGKPLDKNEGYFSFEAVVR